MDELEAVRAFRSDIGGASVERIMLRATVRQLDALVNVAGDELEHGDRRLVYDLRCRLLELLAAGTV